MKLTCNILNYTKLSTLFILLLFTSSFYAQTTWEKQSSSTLNNIHVFGPSKAIACGEDGAIWKTVDQGQTWTGQITSVTNNNLKDVCFVGNKGWIVGDYIILYSDDYGDTWTIQLSVSSVAFLSVDFVDALHGWATGSGGKIYRTIDGGVNWIAVQTTSNRYFFSVDFVNTNVGYAVGLGSLYATTIDGGVTWIVTEGRWGTAQNYFDIEFFDLNDGIRVGYPVNDNTPSIQRTSNGGITWNEVIYVPSSINLTAAKFKSVCWVNGSVAYIVGAEGKILKTTNGGQNWTAQTFGNGSFYIHGVDSPYSTLAYAVGYGGFILKTTDGTTWSELIKQSTLYDLTSVFFVDENKGWATTSSTDGTLIKTTNGGTSWSSVNLNTSETLSDVYFSSAYVGYVVGHGGKVFYTNDGGSSWTNNGTANSDFLECVEFFNDNTGYVGGNPFGEMGRVYRTTNRGNTWTHSNFTNLINDLAIVDAKTVIAVGSDRSIYKSTDYGNSATWVKKNITSIPSYASINSVYFVNSSVGFACCDDGSILKTTDSGDNWTSIFGIPNIALQDIFFVDSQNGWVVGTEGTVAHTTNGGINWTLNAKLTTRALNAMHFPTGKYGWVVGEYGTILKGTRNLSSYKPAPATAVFPPNNDFDIDGIAVLQWEIGLGAEPTGYKLFFGTDGNGTVTPTNIVSGMNISPKEVKNFLTNSLLLNTTYYWQIVPYNANGDAGYCPIWSFKTKESLYFGGGGTTCPDYFFANSLPGAANSPSKPSYSWIDPIANNHTRINHFTAGNDDDGYFGPINIGFNFPFFGIDQTKLFVSTNGVITFDAGYLGKGTNASIPNSAEPNNMIAALLMDLSNTITSIYYKSSATECVLTWWHVWVDIPNAPDDYISFQVIIKPSGYVKFQYNSDESTFPLPTSIGGDALIGIEDQFGYSGAQYRNNGVGGPIFGSPNALAFGNGTNPLPVELNSFTANAVGETVVLNWQTATEVNNYGFEIQVSTGSANNGALSWLKCGFVEGHGNSNSIKEYSFIDADISVAERSRSYRLKQIDIDGAFEYSEIVSVKLELPKVFKLSQNYPNPFNPTTIISYTIPEKIKGEVANVKLTVYDILGREVATLVNKKQSAGKYSVKFDATNLTSGLYLYKLKQGSYTEVKKMLLLK